MTIRLLHVHSGNLYGGIETLLVTLVRAAETGELESRFALCFDNRLSTELHAAGAGSSAAHSYGGAS